jgi:PAB-dependent poly(A)-specific ribonuclease subunit 3
MPPAKSSKPCRNIALYGYCKYANTTCSYNHDGPSASAALVDASPAMLAPSGQKQGPSAAPKRSPVPNARLTAYNPLISELNRRSYLRHAIFDPTASVDLPAYFGGYSAFVLLEPPITARAPSSTTSLFGLPSTVYRGLRESDGESVCLRRLEGVRGVDAIANNVVTTWQNVSHPGLVIPTHIFPKKLGDLTSVFFVSEYFPDALTLEDYMQKAAASFPESMLWSVALQLLSAAMAIHSANLSARVFHPSKILVQSSRIRLTGLGVTDYVESAKGKQAVPSLQVLNAQDIVGIGKSLLALSCGSLAAIQDPSAALQYVDATYSKSWRTLILYLLSKPSPNPPSAEGALRLAVLPLREEMDSIRSYTELLERQLEISVDNGRLFRLLSKLNCITERPEFVGDVSWSETGDRYILKLFRDYVFHQVDRNGIPQINMAHIVDCLNKFDVGAEERLVLSSRDGQSLIVVSYADLRRVADAAFTQLLRGK